MSGETKDPAIKLFGKTIPLPDIAPTVARGVDDNDRILPQSPSSSPEDKEREDDEELLDGNQSTNAQTDEVLGQISASKDSTLDASTGTTENPRSPSSDETVPSKDSKLEEEQNETSKNSQEKTLKKPDKILPCPRCNSMETKFCYYNNYNVNQPRHFCKNCQRYWTAGGTMRNVPVGAGRRKNKSSSSNNYRHLTISEALHKVPNGQLNPNGGTPVLAFGSDSRLCESMASVLNLAEKTLGNGFHAPGGVKVNGPNSDSGLTGKAGKPQTNGIGCPGFPTQVPYYPGPHWPYPWTPVPPPGFCPPGYTMPAFYPGPPYWGWNIPWVPQPSSPCSVSANSSSGPNSPILGKHSRDEAATFRSNGSGEDEPFKDANNTDRSLWTPKTLRIDDPREAAKSSIWATLGIRSDKTDSVTGGGLFKAFQPKGDEKKLIPDTSSVLQANPAALSRSLNFHETS